MAAVVGELIMRLPWYDSPTGESMCGSRHRLTIKYQKIKINTDLIPINKLYLHYIKIES